MIKVLLVLNECLETKWMKMAKQDFINEEVFVEQPPEFESFNFPNHVFKLKKTLYDLKQAPRAWYERLNKFLISSGFKMGKIDTTLFIKLKDNDMLIVQIYVDDIIFGAIMFHFVKSLSSLCMANLR